MGPIRDFVLLSRNSADHGMLSHTDSFVRWAKKDACDALPSNPTKERCDFANGRTAQ